MVGVHLVYSILVHYDDVTKFCFKELLVTDTGSPTKFEQILCDLFFLLELFSLTAENVASS